MHRQSGAGCNPNGKLLASAGTDHTIRLWDVANGAPSGDPMCVHADQVNTLAFSPDGTILASGSSDRTVILWDTLSGCPIGNPLIGHGARIYSVAFSPDGAIIASGDANGIILLWRLDGRQQVTSFLIGHPSQVRKLIFERGDSGHTLLSGSSDGMIVRWDILTGEPLVPPFFVHTALETIALAPDGRTVAVGGADGKITLWDLATKPWQQRARTIANRKLTDAEWQQYIGDIQASFLL